MTYERIPNQPELFFASQLITLVDTIQEMPVDYQPGCFADGWRAAMTAMAAALGYRPTSIQVTWIDNLSVTPQFHPNSPQPALR